MTENGKGDLTSLFKLHKPSGDEKKKTHTNLFNSTFYIQSFQAYCLKTCLFSAACMASERLPLGSRHTCQDFLLKNVSMNVRTSSVMPSSLAFKDSKKRKIFMM